MLETLLISCSLAVIVSAAVDFALGWATRVRLQRLELEIADLNERQLTEAKRRAGQKSQEVRKTGNALDAALVQRLTGHALPQHLDNPDEGGITSIEQAVRRMK